MNSLWCKFWKFLKSCQHKFNQGKSALGHWAHSDYFFNKFSCHVLQALSNEMIFLQFALLRHHILKSQELEMVSFKARLSNVYWTQATGRKKWNLKGPVYRI